MMPFGPSTEMSRYSTSPSATCGSRSVRHAGGRVVLGGGHGDNRQWISLSYGEYCNRREQTVCRVRFLCARSARHAVPYAGHNDGDIEQRRSAYDGALERTKRVSSAVEHTKRRLQVCRLVLTVAAACVYDARKSTYFPLNLELNSTDRTVLKVLGEKRRCNAAHNCDTNSPARQAHCTGSRPEPHRTGIVLTLWIEW